MLYLFNRVLFSVAFLCFVLESNVFVSVLGTINCASDEDCSVTCDETSSCSSQRIICPTSSSQRNYNCVILCQDTNSCVNTSIEAGNGVGMFSFQALQDGASRNVEIQVSGSDSQVTISCTGVASCDYLSLNMQSGQKMYLEVTSGSEEMQDGEVVFSYGNFNINNTKDVMFSCGSSNACSAHLWVVEGCQNITMDCSGEYACNYHNISVSRSGLAVLQSSTANPAITQNSISWINVNSVMVQTSDQAILNGFFLLRNVGRLLLDIAETGSTFGSRWRANNVSQVAINSWNATSFWLVDGSPFQSSYVCDPSKDCNIRVDSTSNLDRIDIACPKSPDAPRTCSFYCTSVTGCGVVRVSTVDTSDVVLNFNEAYNPYFALTANIVDATSFKSTINVTCNYPYSCANGTYNISGYDWVSISCLDYFSCERSQFSIEKFSTEAKMMSNSQGMYEAVVTISNGMFAFVTSEDTHYNGLAFRQTHWTFDKINHVHVHCGHNADCANATFDSSNVGDMLVLCGSGGVAGDSCSNTVFNNHKNASFYLTCQEGDYACDGTLINYDGSSEYETSCEIDCRINKNNPAFPNCRNMNITVNNNPLGYEAILLTCRTEGLYTACEDVYVICNTPQITCRCPMLYEEDSNEWICDGQCGTYKCGQDEGDGSSGGGGLSAGATTAIVLLVLIVVGIGVFFAYQHYKKRRVESQLFVPLGKQNVQGIISSNTTGGYQNL